MWRENREPRRHTAREAVRSGSVRFGFAPRSRLLVVRRATAVPRTPALLAGGFGHGLSSGADPWNVRSSAVDLPGDLPGDWRVVK